MTRILGNQLGILHTGTHTSMCTHVGMHTRHTHVYWHPNINIMKKYS